MELQNFQTALLTLRKARELLDKLKDPNICVSERRKTMEETSEAVLSVRNLAVNSLKQHVFQRFVCEELSKPMALMCGVTDLTYDPDAIRRSKELIHAAFEIEMMVEVNLGELPE